MGVKRIIEYCESNAEKVLEDVDLVEVARQKGGIQLFVDSTSFEIYLMGKFHQSLCVGSSKNALHIAAIGGEYALLSGYLERFIKLLDGADIQLVWMFDGAKGACGSSLEHRYDTWMKRLIHRLQTVRRVMLAYKEGQQGLEKLLLENNENFQEEITPRLFKVEYRCLFEKLYAPQSDIRGETVQSVFGEADLEIANRFFNENDDESKPVKPYAVLSNNSDFALLKNCRFIPVRTFGATFFDVDDDLQMTSAEPFAKATSDGLKKLCCKVIEAERLREHLQLADYDQVADFAFACGNNFSSTLNGRRENVTSQEQRWDFSLFGTDRAQTIQNCAAFVRQHGDLTTVPEIKAKIASNAKIGEAIVRCRKYFNLHKDIREHIEETSAKFSEEAKLLAVGVSRFDYPPEFMAIYHRCFWKLVNLEDLARKADTRGSEPQTIASLLTPLRQIMYLLVMPRNCVKEEESVVEIGLDRRQRIDRMRVSPASTRDSLPSFTDVKPDNQHNQDYFVQVLSLATTKVIPAYFALCPTPQMAYSSYLLRYFLNLNHRRNLNISNTQFYALCCSLLANKSQPKSDVDLEWYCKLTTIPDVRCLTIMEWTQELYWHTAYLFGSLFRVRKLCPSPSDLFSGSLFSAFYIASESFSSADYQSRIENFDEVIDRIMKDQKRIFKKYLAVIKVIVNDDFQVAEPLIYSAGRPPSAAASGEEGATSRPSDSARTPTSSWRSSTSSATSASDNAAAASSGSRLRPAWSPRQ